MKYYRYMSIKELKRYLNNEVIKRPYDKDNASLKTSAPINSMFFFSEKIRCIDSFIKEHYIAPYECLEFIYGINKYDYLIEFKSNKVLKNSTGVYYDIFNRSDLTINEMLVDEKYCCYYSSKEMKLNRVFKIDLVSFGLIEISIDELKKDIEILC